MSTARKNGPIVGAPGSVRGSVGETVGGCVEMDQLNVGGGSGDGSTTAEGTMLGGRVSTFMLTVGAGVGGGAGLDSFFFSDRKTPITPLK
mmetsp:Transcript_28734/g.57871  ORF Transcript_28734/g.57871 Transcript_28734/m.57871 type:complete len:90 (+) Transcript_28734:2443-2712(+)